MIPPSSGNGRVPQYGMTRRELRIFHWLVAVLVVGLVLALAGWLLHGGWLTFTADLLLLASIIGQATLIVRMRRRA